LKELHVLAEGAGAPAIGYGKRMNAGLVYYSYGRMI